MSDFRYDPNRVSDSPNNIEMEIPTYLKWIYGGAAAVLVGGLLAFAVTNDRQTAGNERPGINTPAQTTGSGARAPAETTGSGGATRPAPMQRP